MVTNQKIYWFAHMNTELLFYLAKTKKLPGPVRQHNQLTT